MTTSTAPGATAWTIFPPKPARCCPLPRTSRRGTASLAARIEFYGLCPNCLKPQQLKKSTGEKDMACTSCKPSTLSDTQRQVLEALNKSARSLRQQGDRRCHRPGIQTDQLPAHGFKEQGVCRPVRFGASTRSPTRARASSANFILHIIFKEIPIMSFLSHPTGPGFHRHRRYARQLDETGFQTLRVSWQICHPLFLSAGFHLCLPLGDPGL